MKIEELADLIEDAAQQPRPLIEPWAALDARWQQASTLEEQLSCLVLLEWLTAMTGADLHHCCEFDLPGWSFDVLLELNERVDLRLTPETLFSSLNRANASDLKRWVVALETKPRSFDVLAAELVERLASHAMIELALRVASRISEPFVFLGAAESIAKVCDDPTRTDLAGMAWARTNVATRFDTAGPGFTLAAWLRSLALRPKGDPTRRAALEWLEDRIRVCSSGELMDGQDYEDLRYLLAEQWIELGDVQRGLEWIEAITVDQNYWKVRLAPALPEPMQRDFVLEAVDSELRLFENGQADELGIATLVEASRLNPSVADTIAARLHRWFNEYPVIVAKVELEMLANLPSVNAVATLARIIDWFDGEARQGTRVDLDGVVSDGLMILCKREREGLELPVNSGVLVSWAQRWPRAEELELAEELSPKETRSDDPNFCVLQARQRYRGLALPKLIGQVCHSLPESKRVAVERWAQSHAIDLPAFEQGHWNWPNEAPSPQANLEPSTWNSATHQREAIEYWLKMVRWESTNAGDSQSVAKLEATVYAATRHRVFPELDRLLFAFEWLSQECLKTVWRRRARWHSEPLTRVGAGELALAVWVGGAAALDGLLIREIGATM